MKQSAPSCIRSAGSAPTKELALIALLAVVIVATAIFGFWSVFGGDTTEGESPLKRAWRYKCIECGYEELLPADDPRVQQHWIAPSDAYDCPSCKVKESFVAMEKCPACGDWYLAQTSYVNGDLICPKCKTNLSHYRPEPARQD